MAKKVIFLFAINILFSTIFNYATAAMISATSCNQADVQNAISLAGNGDIVMVPPGNCAWSHDSSGQAPVRIESKNIILMGQGTIVTNLSDNNSDTLGDKGVLIKGSGRSDGYTRITGFDFRGVVGWNGYIKAAPVLNSFLRIDNNVFNGITGGQSIIVYGAGKTVIDNNYFYLKQQGIMVKTATVYSGPWGDLSWTKPPEYGSSNAVFIENNNFYHTMELSAMDCGSGGRVVFRYNTITNGRIVNHGSETSGRERSCYSMEIYNNTITREPALPNQSTAIEMRGGVALIYSNTINNKYDHMLQLDNYRIDKSNGCGFVWGCSDDASKALWDKNAPNGYPQIDQVGWGNGDLLSGSPTPSPVGWPNQTRYGVYEWSNTFSGPSTKIYVPSVVAYDIRSDREYFSDVPYPWYVPFPYPHPLIYAKSSASKTKPPKPTSVSP